MTKWTLEAAVSLCRKVEAIAPAFACHVALTGGTLYKDGERKDCDIMFYRVRQQPDVDKSGLLLALEAMGFTLGPQFGWVQKAVYEGKPVDLFFPHHTDHADDQEYPECGAPITQLLDVTLD